MGKKSSTENDESCWCEGSPSIPRFPSWWPRFRQGKVGDGSPTVTCTCVHALILRQDDRTVCRGVWRGWAASVGVKGEDGKDSGRVGEWVTICGQVTRQPRK